MNPTFHAQLAEAVDAMAAAGTLKRFRHLQSPMSARARMEGLGEILIMSSNNYLGLANDPRVIAAGRDALEKLGAGTSSVRFICGTFDVHRDVERALASFFGTERALTYVSCWAANTGIVAAIVGPEDVILSDELNHASLIDGCRLASRTQRAVYKHGDMGELARLLAEHHGARRKLIVTDGVFSMEGDLAPLGDIAELAARHDAVTLVDDSHGTGVVGPTGRGTAEHHGVQREIDIYTSTLGKALGGAAGGFVASSASVIGLLEQVSRPQIFSNALPPTVAASSLKALQVLEHEPQRVATIRSRVTFLRNLLRERGFEVREHPSAIIPIMVGQTAKAIAVSERLLERGIFVTGFGYPVVPEGTARIRIQISYAHTTDDLEEFVEALQAVLAEMR